MNFWKAFFILHCKKIKREKNNEKNGNCFINPFIYICVQQRLDQKESTPISTMGNCPGSALSR
jgi:hypothetical protein